MAKEAKSVRAAALSVGIFMMTGAGAVPVFSADGPLSGRSLVHLNISGTRASSVSGNLGLIRFAVNDVAPRLRTHSEALWTQIGTGFETPGVGALLTASLASVGRIISGAALTTSVTGSESLLSGRDVAPGNSSVFGVVSFDATSPYTPEPGTYILAITGLATLPFIRRRRLGPVPFE